MIKRLVLNISSGWILVLVLVLSLLADPTEVDEHQRKETVIKSNARKFNKRLNFRSLESVLSE